jgi:hypothetical protein
MSLYEYPLPVSISHFLIAANVPDGRVMRSPEQRSAVSAITGVSVHLVASQRFQYLEINKPEAPSSAGQPDEFLRRQQDPKRRLECNRPPSATAIIPATLLHPVFGEFLDTCNSGNVTEEDHDFAWKLSQAMSSFYDKEYSRAEAVREIFEQHGLHFICTKIQGTKYETDGDISVNGYRYAVMETKNEVGNKGAEPYAQASLYYREATRPHVAQLAHLTFPCLLILIFGLSEFFFFYCPP